MHRRQQTSPLQACLAASLPFIVSSSLQLMARRSTSIAVSSVRDANEMLRCRLYNKTAPVFVRPRAFHTLRVRYALNADSASAGGHLKWGDIKNGATFLSPNASLITLPSRHQLQRTACVFPSRSHQMCLVLSTPAPPSPTVGFLTALSNNRVKDASVVASRRNFTYALLLGLHSAKAFLLSTSRFLKANCSTNQEELGGRTQHCDEVAAGHKRLLGNCSPCTFLFSTFHSTTSDALHSDNIFCPLSNRIPCATFSSISLSVMVHQLRPLIKMSFYSFSLLEHLHSRLKTNR